MKKPEDDGVEVIKPFWKIFPNTWDAWKRRDETKRLTERTFVELAIVLFLLNIPLMIIINLIINLIFSK